MAKARTPRKRAGDDSPEQRLITAALALAERQGWRRTGLAAIAAEAGLPLHEAYALHRSKSAILRAFQRRIDAEVLAGASDADKAESARERLFDTLMRRYEALKPHKAAIRAILRDSVGDPTAIFGFPALRHSMAWMLEGSGIALSGCRGRLLLNLVTGLYLAVLRVFLADDSADLGKTMAALDRGLKRGEQLCRWAGRARGARGAASEEAAAQP
jgi:AcrR family transcriptional regulator